VFFKLSVCVTLTEGQMKQAQRKCFQCSLDYVSPYFQADVSEHPTVSWNTPRIYHSCEFLQFVGARNLIFDLCFVSPGGSALTSDFHKIEDRRRTDGAMSMTSECRILQVRIAHFFSLKVTMID